ncbi:MAG: hypothetical protein J3K34DRAFT_456885 [Monoraphidium minutum]|nr:MAG: hypothetical protein J3K34DRAFT_456885 [Monoraphidium minutum]
MAPPARRKGGGTARTGGGGARRHPQTSDAVTAPQRRHAHPWRRARGTAAPRPPVAALLMPFLAALLQLLRPAAAATLTVINNESAGDTIVFSGDFTIEIDGSGIGVSPPPLTASKSITIDATGRSVSLVNTVGTPTGGLLLSVSGANNRLTIKNVRFPTPGSSVRVQSGASLDAQGCSFTDIEITRADTQYAALFLTSAGASTITNCTFQGKAGASTPGRGVYATSSSALTVTGCTFQGLEPPTLADGGGSGVRAVSTALAVAGTTFTACSSGETDRGGAIRYDGTAALSIAGSSFVDVAADYGGAVWVNGASATIADSSFTGCGKFGIDGGAIYANGSDALKLSLQRCTLTSNSVITMTSSDVTMSGRGGAIFVAGPSLSLDTCTLSTNTAAGSGGAIFVEPRGSNPAATVEIVGSDFSSNSCAACADRFYFRCTRAGLRVRHARDGRMRYCAVALQTKCVPALLLAVAAHRPARMAAGQGGALLLSNAPASLRVTGSTFTSNAGGAGGGGAIYQRTLAGTTTGSITLEDSAFRECNCINSPGGGVRLHAPEASLIRNCEFSGNQALGYGSGGGAALLGAGFAESKWTVQDSVSSTIQENTANSFAGGIYFERGTSAKSGAGDLVIGRTAILSNRATQVAGALWLGVGATSLTIDLSRLEGNVATNGGALSTYFEFSDAPTRSISLSRTTVAGGGATGTGTGNIYIDSQQPMNVTVTECTFSGSMGGPVLRYFARGEQSSLVFSQSTVSGTRGAFDVSGLYLAGNMDVSIASSTFYNNRVDSRVKGVALWVPGNVNTLEVTNSIFADCGGQPCVLMGDIAATIASFTNSLIENQPLSVAWARDAGNIDCAAVLGPLQDNGGDTKTHMPGPMSPVVNAGDTAAALAAGLTTDQAGQTRVQGAVVDMGSVEVQSAGGPFTYCSLFSNTTLITQVTVATGSTFWCNLASACRSECESRAACKRFLAHSCSDSCCLQAGGVGITCAKMATGGAVSLDAPGSGQFGVLCAREYTNVSATCPNATNPSSITPGAVLGDPHLTGFDGSRFLFKGYPDAVFSLISERLHMVNALFGNIGPAHGLETDVWMVGFGVRYGSGLELELRLDIDPRDIQLFRDEGPSPGVDSQQCAGAPMSEAGGQECAHTKHHASTAIIPAATPSSTPPNDPFDSHTAAQHATKMRVKLLDPKFLHIVVNGAHRDDLLRSGKAVEGLAGSTALYFPPPDAVNPGDAIDGPLAILTTPLMELAFYLETEDALHLDLQVKLLGLAPDGMSGVLGQTLEWALTGTSRGAVVDGVLAGDDARFEVPGGLMGAGHAGSLFEGGAAPKAKRGAKSAAAVSRALLLRPWPALNFPLVASTGRLAL